MDKQKFQQSIKETAVTYIIAAFGLIAGLAWNDAVKALLEYVFPLGVNTLLAKFIYAAIVTLFVVLITSYLKRLLNSKK